MKFSEGWGETNIGSLALGTRRNNIDADTALLRRIDVNIASFDNVTKVFKGWGANIRSLALGARRSSIVSDAALWRRTGVNITSSKIWYEAVFIHSLRKSKFIFYNCT